MTTWEAIATTPDRCSQVLRQGRYDACAEAAHSAAWAVFDKLPKRRQTAESADMNRVKELAGGGPATWWWEVAGTTYKVRRVMHDVA